MQQRQEKFRENDPLFHWKNAESGQSTEKVESQAFCVKLSLTNVRVRSIILNYYS